MSNSNDIMLDLETLGTKPGCVVLSIGACTFDLTRTFYVKISIEDSKARGLIEDPETMAWWHKQNPEARREAFSGIHTPEQALGAFADFVRSVGDPKNTFIWGNGADFDLPILEAVYTAVRMKKPWAPFNGRCFRTLKNLYNDVKKPIFEGMKHNALEDAKNQAAHARLILSQHFRR